MLLASKIIAEGLEYYRNGSGDPSDANPYKSISNFGLVEGFHGATFIGMVKTRIDARALWWIGWHLGELLEVRHPSEL